LLLTAPAPLRGARSLAHSPPHSPTRPQRDRKVINVDPRANPGDNTTRTEVRTSECLQAVIFDHFTKRQ
jgi:hypothetical protein